LVLVDPRRRGASVFSYRTRFTLAVRENGVQLTWRFSDAEFERLTARVQQAVASNRIERVHAELSNLFRNPLFHGVTVDLRRLIRLAASSWAHRTRRSAGPATERRLNVTPYLERARPRRGVGAPIYRRHPDGRPYTLADLLESEGVTPM
jgi:hypothetical protein